MNKLKEWKISNRYTWTKMAKEIGISYPALNEIVRFGSPRTQASTVSAIFILTGLTPYDYLDFSEEEKIKAMEKAKSIWDYKLKKPNV